MPFLHPICETDCDLARLTPLLEDHVNHANSGLIAAWHDRETQPADCFNYIVSDLAAWSQVLFGCQMLV